MQAQDATTVWFFKLWPWIEDNKKWIIAVTGIIIAGALGFYYVSSQREQREIDAGRALTEAMISGGAPSADNLLKISADYPSTMAGQRAWLQGAASLFAAGRYADAQAQFQKFLDAHPDGTFSDQAALGVAASLDAQGKEELAVGAYQRILNGSSDAMAVSVAKLATARIFESQGKLKEALTFYEEVARANPNSSLASEAAVRAMQIETKETKSKPAPASAAPTAPTAPTAPLNLGL